MAVALVKLNTSSQEKDQEISVCDAEGRAAGEHRLTNYKKAETSSTKKTGAAAVARLFCRGGCANPLTTGRPRHRASTNRQTTVCFTQATRKDQV